MTAHAAGKERVYLGIDIGGTGIKAGIFDGTGELTGKWQIPTRLEAGGAYILSDIAASAEEQLRSRRQTFADVSGIGIAVPGPVQEGGIVPLAVNLGWKNVNVREEMRELTGVSDIRVGNDAKTAALGEYRMGGWEAYRSAVLITLGTAVGGAVILSGQVIRGAFGAAGELSHIRVNPDETEPCACGQYGHLQQYVSAEGIIRSYRKKLGAEGTGALPGPADGISVKEIFDAAKAGSPAAQAAVRETACILAHAMAAVSCVIDPELYLIGGGISEAGDFFLDAIREEFSKAALPMSRNARIEAARTGNDAGICGAFKLLVP